MPLSSSILAAPQGQVALPQPDRDSCVLQHLTSDSSSLSLCRPVIGKDTENLSPSYLFSPGKGKTN